VSAEGLKPFKPLFVAQVARGLGRAAISVPRPCAAARAVGGIQEASGAPEPARAPLQCAVWWSLVVGPIV